MCLWVSKSVCHRKRVERSTDRNLPPIFTKLATKVEVPGDMVAYCFWWKSEIYLSAKPEVELILTVSPMEKYLQCQIPRKWWEIQCCTQRSDRKPHTCFRLAPWSLTLDDLELSFKVITITVRYFDNVVFNATAMDRYTFHRTYFLLDIHRRSTAAITRLMWNSEFYLSTLLNTLYNGCCRHLRDKVSK